MKRKIVALVALLAFCTFGVSANAAGLKDIFNAKYYADQYKDLQDAFGYDEEALYNHYLTYGINEGRSMNPIIDVVKYREGYEDLDTAFGDNWDAYVDHYFTYGIKEKRDNGTDFDIAAYVEAYDDIEEAFGNDYVAIAEHYQTFGINENRQESSKVYQEVKRQEEIRKQEEVASTPKPDVSDEEQGAHTVRTDFEDGTYIIEEYNEQGDYVKGNWYYANDVLKMECFYVDGVLVKSVLYHEDGSFDYSVEDEFDENGKLYRRIIINMNNIPKSIVYYNLNKQEINITWYDENDNVTQWQEIEYDAEGNKSGITEYDAEGRKSYEAFYFYGAYNKSWECYYDEAGNLVKEIYCRADDSKDEYRYTADGLRTDYLKYDAQWNLSFRDEYQYDEADRIIRQYSYDADGNMTQLLKYEYNETGYVKYCIDEHGRTYQTAEYDIEGNMLKLKWEIFSEDGRREIFFFQGACNNAYRIEIHYGDGSWFWQNMNDEYNVTTESARYDAEGNQINRLVFEYEYGETAVEIRKIEYDENDELAYRTEYSYDENGVQTSVTYDKDGNVV